MGSDQRVDFGLRPKFLVQDIDQLEIYGLNLPRSEGKPAYFSRETYEFSH